MSKTFYVWATIMTPSAARLLTAGLVERGFTVGPLARTHALFWEGEASTLVALKVEGPDTETHSTVLRNVREVLGGLNSMFHSLIVHELRGSFEWQESNIKLPPPKAPELPKEEQKTRFDVLNDAS